MASRELSPSTEKATPDGAATTGSVADKVRLLQWQQSVPERVLVALTVRGDLENYLRSTARQALADKMVRDHAIRTQEIKPDPEDPWNGTMRVFRFSVGVIDRESVQAFADQLARARAEGMQEAAKMCDEKAARYGLTAGFCGPVIAGALHDMGRAIVDAALGNSEPQVAK